MRRATVIGGGIGGLTAAVALQRKGWSVTVCERAPELRPVGAAIAIAANALRALDVIGVGAPLRELSALQGEAGIRRPDGRWLTRTNEAVAARRYGDSISLVLRSTLVELLAERLRPGSLLLGTAVRSVDPGTGVVTTEAGEITADLVVAADGIDSAVRKALFPRHPGPVYTGVTSWRLIAPAPGLRFGPSETWGRGRVFGVSPLADRLVYCYATDMAPPGDTAPAGEKDALLRRFRDWHSPIPQILELTDPAKVLRHDLYALDIPLPAFHRGRVALLGDAAHAMTPHLGQGGCQAIEDAVVLAHLVDGPGDLPAYTAARLPRTTRIARRSRMIGRISSLRDPLAVRLRDGGLALSSRLIPHLMLRAMDDVLTWRPPV